MTAMEVTPALSTAAHPLLIRWLARGSSYGACKATDKAMAPSRKVLRVVAVGNTSLQMCGDSRYGQEWFSVRVFDHGGYEVGRYWNYLDAEATMLEWTGYLNRGGTVAGWLARYGVAQP